jgi:uncharacterized protein YcfL
MPNAKLIALPLAALALVACQKQQQQPAQDQNMSVDEGVPNNQVMANADIETLPPDESSTTPSNQLQNGFDNPDVNDLGNSD